MLVGTRSERCHQARAWPERAIQSRQEIAKGHEPQSAATRGEIIGNSLQAGLHMSVGMEQSEKL